MDLQEMRDLQERIGLFWPRRTWFRMQEQIPEMQWQYLDSGGHGLMALASPETLRYFSTLAASDARMEIDYFQGTVILKDRERALPLSGEKSDLSILAKMMELPFDDNELYTCIFPIILGGRHALAISSSFPPNYALLGDVKVEHKGEPQY